ncbi:MAG: phosphatase PAP2 family protein [Paracoccaceae bacterium]
MTSRPMILNRPAGLFLGGALAPAEWMLVLIVLGLALGSVMLAAAMGRVVNWSGFLPGIVAALGLTCVGIYARHTGKAPRLGSCAIGVGLFMGFAAFASIFIFALFPLPNPLIDQRLIAADAAFGYDWAGFVTGLAQLPLAGTGLSYVYRSALPQMVLVIILLGVLGRERDMQRFLLVGMLCMVVTIGIFFVWPSIGPSAYATIPDATAARIDLVFTSAVGNHSRDLVNFGPDVISPETIVGLVAFPSYHIIMALMVCWFSRRTVVFPLFMLSSLAMIPATLAHGGHHLMDLMGGVAIFVVAVWLTARLVPAEGSAP